MPKQEGQKSKLLALLHIFEQQTDEEHLLNVPQLVELLARQGILCERKSVYSDIDALNALGYDIRLRRGRSGGYWMATRPFELAEVLGFRHICTLTVQEHDKMIGYVSQLCHAIAVSLMCANDNSSLCEYTGDSFRDLTRIARINEKMWAELFLWNKENLISEIDQFDAALDTLRNALVAGDREKLEEMFRLSTQRRAAFDKKLPE